MSPRVALIVLTMAACAGDGSTPPAPPPPPSPPPTPPAPGGDLVPMRFVTLAGRGYHLAEWTGPSGTHLVTISGAAGELSFASSQAAGPAVVQGDRVELGPTVVLFGAGGAVTVAGQSYTLAPRRVLAFVDGLPAPSLRH